MIIAKKIIYLLLRKIHAFALNGMNQVNVLMGISQTFGTRFGKQKINGNLFKQDFRFLCQPLAENFRIFYEIHLEEVVMCDDIA